MLYLVFQVGSDRYAIEGGQVIEVLPLVHWKYIPQAPAGVVGVFDYHHTPVPLIDLAELMLGKPSRRWIRARIIVVNKPEETGEEQLLGLLVEQVTETTRQIEWGSGHSGVVIAGAPYLGPITINAGGIIQRIEIQNLLPRDARSQALSEVGAA